MTSELQNKANTGLRPEILNSKSESLNGKMKNKPNLKGSLCHKTNEDEKKS